MAHKRLSTRPDTSQPVLKRAWGYRRVSTRDQEDSDLGLADQERQIRGRALEMGWDLVEILTDVVSGATPLATRENGARLLEQAKAGDVVVASKLDRMFRSAADALATLEQLKRRRVELWLLDIGNCTGGGVAELLTTIMSAVAAFERNRIAERTRDAKSTLRRKGLHQGGSRPFGWQFGEANGTGRARELVEDEHEQQAIAVMRKMRARGSSLMAIRDAVRARGFEISHETVRGILARSVAGETA